MPPNKGYKQDGRPTGPSKDLDPFVPKGDFQMLGRDGTTSTEGGPEPAEALREETGGLRKGPRYSSLTKTEHPSLPRVEKPPSGPK